MPSLSFDPIAHVYDATRGYPDGIAQQIAQAINSVAKAGPQTAMLEMGIGTGRIAFPLASLGHTYTGVDISQKMLEQLQMKLQAHAWQEVEQPWGSSPDENVLSTPVVRRFIQGEPPASMRLVISDMTDLPFHDASFDVVIAVHVFHLIDDWQQAVRQALRVLRPGGLLLHCWDEYEQLDLQKIRGEWQKRVVALGGNLSRRGATSNHTVAAFLQAQGFHPQELSAFAWEQTSTPRQAVERVTSRQWSSTWEVPEDIFKASADDLWKWVHETYGADIDTQRKQERHFMISKTQV